MHQRTNTHVQMITQNKYIGDSLDNDKKKMLMTFYEKSTEQIVSKSII